MQDRKKEITKASWVGIIGNSILALLKIIFGIISRSMALIGDGIDSSTDIVISIITLFAAKIISKPPDREHAYGHHRAETIATIILAFIIFFAGAQLFMNSISKIFFKKTIEVPSNISIYITIISIIGKIFLAFYQYRVGKKTNSSMLIANGQNMRNDIIISSSVLVGLMFTFWFNLPILDSITATIISLWIIKVAYDIVIETNIELMDGVEDTTIYEEIFRAIDSIKGAYNPHRTRVRKLANFYIVDTDIEVDGNLNVLDGHKIAMEVEKSIKENVENVYDVIVHVEPIGNVEHDESFGLTEDMLEK
ncbi:cation diffusion facilitator family transporter [Defluviitalea phaphyphila]|uniref:cation diffusion facilitator family transporter n=1 Tax=Defluviitalea phaphyphila TaxID=1473580 RepID=UPI0007311379|nr:cation diffusion facilitator family transporter [Defluviitalea phaphyphila]